MQLFDEHIKQKFDATEIDLTKKLTDIPDWNRRAINEDDPDLDEEFRRVISDESIKN